MRFATLARFSSSSVAKRIPHVRNCTLDGWVASSVALRSLVRRLPALPTERITSMDFRLELVAIPVSDVDRAKAFYADQVGFNADHDHRVSDEIRFVQLTPPGSACSIVLGTGITEMAPGSQKGLQVVVED